MVWKIILAVVVVFGVVAYLTREKADLSARYDGPPIGDDIDAFLAGVEGGVPNLRDGVAKRVIWAGAVGQKTPLSVVYLHGFSATSEEIRPVPDDVARALGANLYYARLSGHGRDGAAMAEPSAADWVRDLDETLTIARAIGDEVLILSTSTGGTLAALAATEPDLARDVKGMVLVSPNFGLNNPLAFLLSSPFARQWIPLVLGYERSFEVMNDRHAAFWTTTYPVVSALPMKALVNAVMRRDFSTARVPALFVFSDDDAVVRPDISRKVAASWGAGAKILAVTPGPDDDPNAHVIAGDTLSPGQSGVVATAIIDWASGL